MSSGQQVHISFKKGGAKPDSAIIKRFDGTEVFIQYRPNMVFHDLAHFAIESALMLRVGFFWLINLGLQPSDFELPKERRPGILKEAMKDPNHVAIEYIANQLMVEAMNSGPIDNFIELLDQSMETNGADQYSFRFDNIILNDIRELYTTIINGWRVLSEGSEKKVMVYFPGLDK